MTDRRALLLFAALAILTAFFPVLWNELPVPAGGARLALPDGGRPAVRNDELGDVPSQFIPWTAAVADAYRELRLPWRFAANGCGTPLWANPQAQAVTPTTAFVVLLGPAWGFGMAAAAKLFLAAAGIYVFARRRGLSRESASWAGVAYGFALQMTAWIHFPHTWPLALAGFVLMALERVARGERGGFGATAAVVTLLLLGGYPEGEFFVALCGAVFFAALLAALRPGGAEAARRFGRAAAGALLALGVTAAYTWPSALAIARGERSVMIARAASALAPAISIPDLARLPLYAEITRFWIAPEAQGNPRDEDKFGPYSFAGRASGYAGILVLAFALAACFRRGAPRTVRLARWGVVAAALYLLWYPPLVFLWQATPGLSALATRLTTNRANLILVLFLALLAAFELDRIRGGGGTRGVRIAAAFLLGAVGVVTLEFARSPERPPWTAWRAAVFALPALLLVVTILLSIGPPTPARTRRLTAFLVAATALDLLRIGARFNPGTRREDWYPETAFVRTLREASRGGRFAADGGTLTGTAYMYGLEDVGVHDPVAPADYQDVLGAAAGYTGPREYGGRVTRLDAPILDLLDARARVAADGSLDARQTPRAVFPRRIAGVEGPQALLAAVAAEPDFGSTAYRVGAGEEFRGEARILSYARPRPEEIRVRVAADEPRVLVVPETTDGGWRARAGGAPLETFAANGAFLAVRVPGGESEIVCRYAPPGLRAGLAISVGSLLVIGAVLRRGARSSSRSTEAGGSPRDAPGTAPPLRPRDGEASASEGRP